MIKKNSIYFHLLILFCCAALFAAATYIGITFFSDKIIDDYLEQTNYEESQEKNTVEQLRRYVKEQKVSADDWHELTDWSKKYPITKMQVYKEDILVYDLEIAKGLKKWADSLLELWDRTYSVAFADGEAEVCLLGAFGYQFYMYIRFLGIGISCFVFLAIMYWGIQKRIGYICKLNREVQILERGNLDRDITIYGNDEISALANSLDHMRITLKEQNELKSRIVKDNQKIIREMSHDLRTPLTALLLYTELINESDFKNETYLQEYVTKINYKLHQMKQLAERIFEYSLLNEEVSVELEEPEFFRIVVYDMLSDLSMYLENEGFQCEMSLNWDDNGMIRINYDYLSRIFDNIISNILKYADKNEKIEISVTFDQCNEKICFKNRIREVERKKESTQIGLMSISNMMQRMGGSCSTENLDHTFVMYLKFLKNME